jgi:CRISPR-associated protein Cmr4
MYKLARPLFLHCLSPLHAGTGSDLGYIDLPIQREKHTGFPKVEASSLKGALREVFEEDRDIDYPTSSQKIKVKVGVDLAFGPDNDKGESHAGALGFTDARLLLFPVKSLKGIFAWVTCPRVLEKFKAELLLCNDTKDKKELKDLADKIPTSGIENTISDLGTLGISGKVVLEEYAFTLTASQTVKDFADELNKHLQLEGLNQRLIILKNDEFTDFVKLHTEVISRIVLNDKGTTDNLFNEEFLPAESVLYSLVLASPIFKEKDADKGIFKENGGIEKDYQKLMKYFELGLKDVFQLGGDATLGKGIIKTTKTLLAV